MLMDADGELDGSVMKQERKASRLIMYSSRDRPVLQFGSKTVMSMIAKPIVMTGGKSPSIWKSNARGSTVSTIKMQLPSAWHSAK